MIVRCLPSLLLFLWAATTALTGCRVLIGYDSVKDSGNATIDQGKAVDQAAPRDASDGALLRDGVAGITDAADARLPIDQPAPNDAPADLKPPLDAPAKTDQTLSLDLRLGTDLPSSAGSPCAGQADTEEVFASGLVTCRRRDGTPTTACEAAAFCGSKWHLCSPDEYLAAGGDERTLTSPAWLSSCSERQGTGTAFGALTNTSCADCARGTGPPLAVLWECNGTPASNTTATRITVLAGGTRKLIIGNLGETCAYWNFASVDTLGKVAACCY
jgi:hypothetical protein